MNKLSKVFYHLLRPVDRFFKRKPFLVTVLIFSLVLLLVWIIFLV